MSAYANRQGAVTLQLETPEGVALAFPVAGSGERLVAYIFDFLVIIAIISLLLIPVVTAMWGSDDPGVSGWAAAIASMAIFFVLNFYFAWHEIRHSGVTPGKRRVGIRVISRSGGPLTVQSVLVRNMTRNIEVTVPLQILVAPSAVFPGSEGAAFVIAVGWVCLVSCLPLLNRMRLRPGDLLGGTVVVDVKQAELDRDMADAALAQKATFLFETSQLQAYGVFELQVLEEYLRTPSHIRPVAEEELATKIQRKIGWKQGAVDGPRAETFLSDFYAAQRRHLEQNMLLGKRKERKDRPRRATRRGDRS